MTRTTRRDLVKLGGGAAAAAALAGSTAAPARASGRHATRRLPVGYPLGPFTRDSRNPILRPGTQPWESKFVFNPAAVVKDGRVHLLYRAQGPDGRSSIGLATSSDGVHFTRRPEPVLVATEPFELPGGCEDPRVVLVGGTYYMTYTGYDGTSARLCLATSRNFVSWTKHGALFPDFVTRGVDKPWSKSGAILTRRIGGKYYMYFGDKDIYFATSSDLIHWTPGPVGQPVMRPQPGTYTEELLEPGPPPLITENGQILLIHNSAAKDPDGKLI
jgi:beta-1,2-mannosidase